MKAAQIIWYARRARTMERGELGSRVARALQGATDYVHCRLRGRSAFQRNPGAGPFRFCHHPDPMLPPLQWEFEPTEAQIDDLLSGVHHALGFAWAWRPGPEVWHRAPDTGNAWPAKFAGLIDHRPGNPVGDVRVTWEPNRLQQLIALALLTKSLPDRCFDAAALLKRQLFCWVDANPMRTGVNYTSAMECALRILSVSFASDLARPLLLRDRAYWAVVTKLILEHAAFVKAHLSLFSSMGNHTVAECTGLFVAALIFPELPAAAGWEACAREVLERAARREVLTDGGAAEQALRYHAQVIDYLEIAVRVGEHFGRDMSTLAALHRSGAAFLARFHVERHDLPCTGDDDEGQALSRYFVSSWADDARRAAKTGSNASVSLWSGGGYSIIRSANDDAELIIDHGPLGLPPNFGHGHADALAVQLRIGGEPVLIDPGTFSYGGDARWRNYFRGTAAHNTVTVDGRSQAKPAGPFLWSTSYACRLIHADSKNERSAVVVARHDGYESIGVVHTRAVRVVPGLILILDRLEGHGNHELALRWHFAGAVREGDGNFRLEALPGFRCAARGGAAHLLTGADMPPGGWRSAQYGRKEPVCTLELRASNTLPHEFVTAFSLPSDLGGRDWDAEVRMLGNLLDGFSAASELNGTAFAA